MNPGITVIICWHTGELLKRCIESLNHQTHVTFECYVVCDDHPPFELPSWAWILLSKDGPAGKRNLAASKAKGKYLVFLDDDVELSPHCLYQLKRGLEERPQSAMEFAKILKMDRRDVFDDCGSWLTPTGFLWSRAGNNLKDVGQYDEPCRILAGKSATCIVRRSAFNDVFGFDPAYFILGEETDLAWRMWLFNTEVWYNPRAQSWHAFGTSLKPKQEYYSLERIHYHGCKNYITLLVTHLSWPKLLTILPIHLSIWIASIIGFLIRGEWERGWNILRGLTYCSRRWKIIMRKRMVLQSTRRISDKALLPHITRNPQAIYYVSRLWRYMLQGLHG